MSPEKANICIVDDDSIVIYGLTTLFETSDHKVVLTAKTKEAALELIDSFKEKKIDVVILDTKLEDRDYEGKASKEILDKIRQEAPDVKVITMSSGTPLPGGDIRMTKTYSRQELMDAVNSL